ncbi:VOC family protein [Nocardioides sp. Root140]|uniref:VOC family protein n=1 Tax=Nocardioides sp. Root140 TaxID=1736460 RepID=UPI0006FEF19F|nr:VOC family protein [Nocardioides sp. Root140]KQY57656.1 hypothetical protein ASD30_09595 [Nocardioides sp. Root140]
MSLCRYKDLCIDATDAAALATFWGAALGLDVRRLDDGDALLSGATKEQAVWVNTVPEPRSVKHRLHLDIHTGSVSALVDLGATVVDDTSFPWTVMTDPEGGEFCAFVRDEPPETRIYELVLDCADPERIATWWAEVLGGRLEGEAEQWGLEEIPGAPFEYLVFVKVPEPKSAKNRVHLDLTTPDLGALTAAGATVLAELESWTVLADPEGNEFCAFPES